MSSEYYDSELTAEQIEQALNAIHGVIAPANNGKVLAVENGVIVAKSVSEWGQGGYPEPTGTIQITENGTVNVKDYASAEVNVQGGGGSAVVQPLSVTQNGTYNPPSGVNGYAPVTVNVSGGGGIEILLNEHEYKTTSGGTFSYSKEIEIQTNGSYFVSLISYSSRPTISINGVHQSLSFESAAYYAFYYIETIILQLGDIISFSVPGNGKCAAFAQVIKLL